MGIKVFAFTNQPGISREKATVEDFRHELKGFGFDNVFLYPHQHGEGCECRKPKIGMLKKAANDYHLQLDKCVVNGDRWTDMVAAKMAVFIGILVLTGAGKEAMGKYRNKWIDIKPDLVAEN